MALPTNYRAKREKDKVKDEKNNTHKKRQPLAQHLETQKKNQKGKKELQAQKVNNPNARPPPSPTASHEIESPAVTSPRKIPYASSSRNRRS